jgi:hypothetical protein
MVNEHDEDKEKLKKMNPYQRLGYIHELAMFASSVSENPEIQKFCKQIIEITEKYKG